MTVIARTPEDMLAAINNLRGYRCAEQSPFLAHVDDVYVDVCALVGQLEGAVRALRDIAAVIATAEASRSPRAGARE